MTYWRARVEKPDGTGGWTLIATFGVDAGPGASYIHGDTALAAAHLVLGHHWPVDLVAFNRRDDPGKWNDYPAANTAIADHRIALDIEESRRWSVPSGQPVPEPATFTVAELRLETLRAEAAALAADRAKLKALNDQVRLARRDVEHGKYRVEHAAEEALRAGVAEPDVAKASRPPRKKPLIGSDGA
jgi:hypothetical protein